jgi:hypothetical protein
VEGQATAGEQDDIEREQRQKGVQAVSGGGLGNQRAVLIVPQRVDAAV